MNKSFREGFLSGCTKALQYGIVFVLGVWFGYYYLHPYEQCSSMYDNPEDVSECVWIKENK